MTNSKAPASYNLKLNRLEALTDGIFAIAMTLLVLSIDIPENDLGLQGKALHKMLLGRFDQLINYLISFLLLGLFWTINHRQCKYLKGTNQTHIWINISMLVFICLVPFTSSVKSDFPEDWLANLYFNLNMFILAVVNLINWIYVTANNRLIEEKYHHMNFHIGKENTIIFLATSLVAVGCSFIIPGESSLAFLLIPAIKILKRRKQKTPA